MKKCKAAGVQSAAFPEPVLDVVRELQRHGYRAYLVGGCVRDWVRGQAPKDFDVATSARPEQVQRVFKKVIPTGLQHGTVTVLSKGTPVEVTTFRVESGYDDGRRPTRVEFRDDVREDLARRDFTINAMALDPISGELVDPFGGRQDLEARVVRAVGDASARFGEDGLRALRAVRFAAVLGFDIEPATLAAIPATLDVFRRISIERVRDELTKLLLSDRPAHGLRLLLSQGLLQQFLPEAAEDAEARFSRVERTPAELVLRLAGLLHGLPEPGALARRLKLPNAVNDDVQRLCGAALPKDAVRWSDGRLRRAFAQVGRERVEALLELALASQAEEPDVLAHRIQALLATAPPLTAKDLALRGDEVMAALGVGPSPRVGQATRWLLEQVLDAPELNTPESLRRLLASFVES